MATQFLNISAKVLLVIWGLCFFLFGAGVFIHLLLILVVASLIARYVLGRKTVGNIKKSKTN